MVSFLKLFEPTIIGSLVVKSRIVMPAIATNFATENGAVTNA